MSTDRFGLRRDRREHPRHAVLLEEQRAHHGQRARREAIVFVDEDGKTRHLTIPEEERRPRPTRRGASSTSPAVRLAMAGGPMPRPRFATSKRSPAVRSRRAPQFLDLNVDEVSNKLAEQLEAMRFLATALALVLEVPLSIDSSNLEIIAAGVTAALGRPQPASGRRCSTRPRSSASRPSTRGTTRRPRRRHSSRRPGMPANTEERVENASRIVEASLKRGLALGPDHVDPLVFPVAVDRSYGRHCLDAIRELRRLFGPEIHITGGISNVSFGLPTGAFSTTSSWPRDRGRRRQRHRRPDRGEPAAGYSHGPDLGPFQLALDVLTGTDENCRAYMKAHRAGELSLPGS